MGYCTYILYSQKPDRFYVWMTEDLDRRILHHNHPIDPTKFTAKGIPWELFCQSPAPRKKMHPNLKG